MKTVACLFLLAVCSAVMWAQSNDLTIRMSEGTPEYCLGFYGAGQTRSADDITLRLPLKLEYVNHRSGTIILPIWNRHLVRMMVSGQEGSITLRDAGGGKLDAKGVMAMPRPDTRSSPFLIIAGGKDAWISGPVETVLIPVLDHSKGLDLRGKTVQIVLTRDFRSIAPDVVEKLNEKWKDYGTVWAGVVETNTITFYMPKEPLTRDCTIPLPR